VYATPTASSCSFAAPHVPEGLRIYSANGVRHRQYTFRLGYLFASEILVRLPTASSALSLSLSLSLSRGCSQGFPCDEKPGDNDKVSHGRAGDVARPFNVAPLLAEIAAAGGVAINFLKTQARPFGLRMRIAHARLVPFETEERKGRKATRFRGCQIRE